MNAKIYFIKANIDIISATIGLHSKGSSLPNS